MSARDRSRTARRAAAAALVTLAILELGARVVTGRALEWGSLDDRGRYGTVDPRVGHVPRAGLAVEIERGDSIHTGPHGIRSNGAPAPPSDRPRVLVVGDSFAFGDEVDDRETWPALLEQARGAPVINAAVPGFGLDQAVLRAEQLAPVVDADVVLVSFIPHDVVRCQMSIWSGNAKPYFDVEGGALAYHAAPAPSALQIAIATPLTYSVLVDSLFHDALERDGPDTVVHERGLEVACLLMDRLATLGRERGAEVLVIAEPQSPRPDDPRYRSDPRSATEVVGHVVGCARRAGLPTLDLVAALAGVAPGERERMFHLHGHHSPEGNRWVARQVLERMRAL